MRDDNQASLFRWGSVFSGAFFVIQTVVFIFFAAKLQFYWWFLILVPYAASMICLYLFLRRKDMRFLQLEDTTTSAVHLKDAYSNIIQNFREGLIITDAFDKIVMVNFAGLKVLGLKGDQVVGRSIVELLPIGQFLNKPIESTGLQYKNALNDELDLNISIIPLMQNGRIQGCIYSIKNLTDQNKYEKLKLDFVTQVAHQLRTPLSVSRNYIYLLVSKSKNKLSPQEMMYLERAYAGIDRLGALIDNLLNISRIEKGELKPQFKSASMDEVIVQTVDRVMNYATQRNIKIVLNHPNDKLVMSHVDPLLIGEAFNNLLVNAVDFSKDGTQVEVVVERLETEIRVHVKDYGIGIPTEAFEKLFTKFFKVTSDLQQTSQGIGLGLYNAKAIVEAHKGRIWMDSILGRGSTFSFSLPLH